MEQEDIKEENQEKYPRIWLAEKLEWKQKSILQFTSILG